MFDPVVIDELCHEHAAVHIHYPADLVPMLIRNFEQRGAYIADLDLPQEARSPEALAEYFSQALSFPEITTNWNRVNDWATDENVVGNPAATLIVVRGLENLAHQRPEDRQLPIKLWAQGVRGFQFLEQAFHAVLVGEDPAGTDVAGIFRERVPIYRMNPEMFANIGYGSTRIPVYDWRTDPPTLVIE
jgi:hypothetical protein